MIFWPGTIFMPPKWALGYHQCRWSYESEKRVCEVYAFEFSQNKTKHSPTLCVSLTFWLKSLMLSMGKSHLLLLLIFTQMSINLYSTSSQNLKLLLFPELSRFLAAYERDNLNIIYCSFMIIDCPSFADSQKISREGYTLWCHMDGYRLHGWFSLFHFWSGMFFYRWFLSFGNSFVQ